jgi:small subunit ribosomal protein S8
MYTDPISDLLTRIRNASRANMSSCTVPYSKIKENILKILLDKKFITKYEKTDDKFPELVITVEEGRELNLKRISKPGQRIYAKIEEMKPIRSSNGTRIVSTSKGLMTSEDAKKQGLGGEVICEVF